MFIELKGVMSQCDHDVGAYAGYHFVKMRLHSGTDNDKPAMLYTAPEWGVTRKQQMRNDRGTIVIPIMPELQCLTSCDMVILVLPLSLVSNASLKESMRLDLIIRPAITSFNHCRHQDYNMTLIQAFHFRR